MEAELKVILNIETVDFSNPEVFQKRLAAAKSVFEKMNAGEREDVFTKLEKYKNEGLPQDRQRL